MKNRILVLLLLVGNVAYSSDIPEKDIMDYLWVLISAMLVFIMQAGFMALETGLTRAKNSINVAIKNMSDFILSIIAFWFVGFGLMFGKSLNGIIGISDFLVDFEIDTWKATFFVFQAVFVGTSATIDSGAVAERAKFSTYLLMSFITSAFIYPVFGHWAWGSFFYPENYGWLEKIGFLDFAGSTVVHSTGAWIGLAGVIIIGPRLHRFTPDGKVTKIRGHNLVFAYLGVFLLFFGWFGFNSGSTFAATKDVSVILANTIISASFGGVTSLVISWLFVENRLPEPEMIINGILGGLVGITAGCYYIDTKSSIVVGIVSGLLVYLGTKFLEKMKLDDVVGAIPVHGFAGVWGTIATGLFIKEKFLIEFEITRSQQITAQLIGCFVCFIWAFGISYVIMKIVNKFSPMRVPRAYEEIGLNISEHGASSGFLELSNSVRKIIENRNFKDSKAIDVEFGTEVGDLTSYFNTMISELKQKEEVAEEALESLKKIAVTDGLTKISNRKHIMDTLDKEISRSSRYEKSLSIFLFDIDFFKKVNDNFGHLSGDKVLKCVAKKIKDLLRKSDFIGRYGGEEFLVIFPETDLAKAYSVSNRIRDEIESIEWDFNNGESITISGGVVENYGEDSLNMLKRADELLYYAKESGRNKVEK